MDMGQIPLFSLLTNRMSWLSSRQSVLSENVANAATPNYVARDLKPMDFQTALAGASQGTALATTDVRHIKVNASFSGPAQPEVAAGEGGTPMGNVVWL